MTNEEIQRAAHDLLMRVDGLIAHDLPLDGYKQADEAIGDALRRFVSQAYEEAAQTIEAFRPSDYHSREVREALQRTAEERARHIRALKDPLVQESVSSLS